MTSLPSLTTVVIEEEITVSFKGMTGGWSKWGGARVAVIQEEIRSEWYCQSCGRPQPKHLTPYLAEVLEKEYFRVCAVCLHNGCHQLRQRLGDSE